MNTEERQLSDMLRRVTPEPPRQVAVEDVAFRLAHQSTGHRRGHREPRARRSWVRSWAPALAAASVVVVAGASAGIASVVTSHHAPASAPRRGVSSASASSRSPSASPSQVSTSAGPTSPPQSVADGIWGAELIDRQTFAQDSLTSADGSLYATTGDYLDRISPVTGNVLTQTRYTASVSGPPVVSAGTVWVVSSYAGGSVVLHGYDLTTLAQVASVTVPVSGSVSSTASNVLTTGSGGYLYVAAGRGVAVVNPSTGKVIRQISVPAGPVNSVAISPEGKLYVGAGTFELLTYNPSTGAELGSSAMSGLSSTAGNLIATEGGVWGTAGVGMSEWTWFAPDADLTRMVRIGGGAGGGLASIPTASGDTVWVGGSHTLVCASPVTGQVLKSVTIPTDGGVVEYFGAVTVSGGRTYAIYQNLRSEQAGVVTLTPPNACSG